MNYFFDRVFYKESAKAELKISYVQSFIVGLILLILGTTVVNTICNIISGNIIASNYTFKKFLDLLNTYRYGNYYKFGAALAQDIRPLLNLNTLSLIFLTSVFFPAVFEVFVRKPLSTGACNFFINAPFGRRDVSQIFDPLKENYANIVRVQFSVYIRIALCSLLFIIPGVIKSYQYRYVDFILAENPNINAYDAMELSTQMTDNNKFNMFVMDLSFLGWAVLLGFIPLGIGTYLLEPYLQASWAQAYLRTKEQLHMI